MTKQVLHLQIYRPGAFGGVVNTTVCGRVRNGQDYNVADDRNGVTCSFCLRAIKLNYAAMKWENWKPKD